MLTCMHMSSASPLPPATLSVYPLFLTSGTEVLKAAAINMDRVWSNNVALWGKTRQPARHHSHCIKAGSEKWQWRRWVFVWAVSSKEQFCRKKFFKKRENPQLKRKVPKISEVALFEKSAVCWGFSLRVCQRRITFMILLLSSQSFVFFKAKGYFYVLKLVWKPFFV